MGMAENEVVNTTQKKAEKPASVRRVFSPIEVFAYVMVGVSTMAAAIGSIYTSLFKNLAEHEIFKDVWTTRSAAYKKLYEQTNHSSFNDLVEAKNTIVKDFNKAINERLEKLKISKNFFKGTWQKFRLLEGHEQRDVIVRLGVILSIAVGGFLLFISNRKNKKAIAEQNERIEAVTAKSGKAIETEEVDIDTGTRKTHARSDMKKSKEDILKDGPASAMDQASKVSDGIGVPG